METFVPDVIKEGNMICFPEVVQMKCDERSESPEAVLQVHGTHA